MSCCAIHHGSACTGGANGIGLAICCRLAQEGARVFMADMDEAAAPAALDAVRSAASGDADVHFVRVRLKLIGGLHISHSGLAVCAAETNSIYS
jgi:NAD(P)-dependent dehydrogenase (short-subunit alcohol dehydrogenase family)